MVVAMIDPLDPSTLERARKAAKLSRADLAAAVGVHQTTILRIENGGVDPRVDGTWAPLVRYLQSCELNARRRRRAAQQGAASFESVGKQAAA